MVVIVLTLALFILALVVKGFKHDLFLEIGVFLISAKLVLMAYKISLVNEALKQRLDAIQETLLRMEDSGRSS